MKTIYYAVDPDGTEIKFDSLPERATKEGVQQWDVFIGEGTFEELKPGTILDKTGKKLTWEDEPLRLEF